jgi:hypothetical protein
MDQTPINYENFGQEDYTFSGIYRGVVEDNQDPMDIGRIRVRIYGIHSFDENETPVSHLPWAETCLSMYYSGGKNLDNNRDKPSSDSRYRPNNESNQTLQRKSNTLETEIVDQTFKSCGTGAHFVVPQKGSQVWIFFENGDHTRPIVFGAAVKKDDWVNQRLKLIDEINKKRKNADEIRQKFKDVLDKNEHKGKDIAAKAKVKEINDQPKLNFFNLKDNEEDGEIDNCHITSTTSPGGVTHIIVNREHDGKKIERHYLIHKSEINYQDNNGQVKRLIGFKHFPTSDSEICGNNEPEEDKTGNDFQEAIANNYELHIGGDFETHVMKSNSVQIDGDMQVNVGKNISFVSRNGNVNIIVNKGDCNLSVNEGMINAFSEKQIQIKTNSDANIKVGGNVNIESTGNLNIKSGGNIILEASGSFNVKSNGESSFSCSKFNVSADSSFDVSAGSQFKIDGSGFGGNATCEAALLKGTHSQILIPKYPRGPASPSPKSSSPTKSLSANSVSFIDGKDTIIQDPNEPAFKDDGE